MKTKTAKGTKRFLSAVLAFAMTAGLVPFPAHAAGTTVTYNRKEPEVGILNAETGYNARLYADIKGSIANIKNPMSGRIVADKIGSITIDENIKQPADCVIEERK